MDDPLAEPNSKRRVASPEAIAIVREALAIARRPDGATRGYAGQSMKVDALGEEALFALEHLLGSEDVMERVQSALWVCIAVDHYPDEVPQLSISRAHQELEDALSSKSIDLHLTVCSGVARLKATPPRLAKPLLPFARHDIAFLRYFAAVAVSRTDLVDGHILEVLRDGLSCEILATKILCATSLLRLSVDDIAVRGSMKSTFEAREPIVQVAMLDALANVGPEAADMLGRVLKLIADPESDAHVRQRACMCAGSISRGTINAHPALMRALQSSVLSLVQGAAAGFALSGSAPAEAVQYLIGRLSHDEPEVRAVAARSLKFMGRPLIVNDQVDAMSALLKRVGYERTEGGIHAVSLALAEIGVMAVEPLLHIVEVGDPIEVDHAEYTLRHMEDTAVEAMAERLASTRSERVQWRLTAVLSTLGENAAPAVAVLTNLLNGTADDAFALAAIKVLSQCGRGSPSASAALIRRVAASDGDVALAALGTLRAWGPSSAEAVDVALAKADGDARRRLLEAKRWLMPPQHPSGFDWRLNELGRDDLLLTFVEVSKAFGKEAKSWSEVARKLGYQRAASSSGPRRTASKGVSPGSLRVQMRKLERELERLHPDLGESGPVALTTGRNNVKGGLSDLARRLLPAVEAHLAKLSSKKGLD